MRCFQLHFSDFNVFLKKNKNLLQLTFEKKITCCAKREKKKLIARKNPSRTLPRISNCRLLGVLLNLYPPPPHSINKTI